MSVLAKEIGRSRDVVYSASVKHDWSKRATAYHAYHHHLDTIAMREAFDSSAQRHVQVLNQSLTLLEESIAHYLKEGKVLPPSRLGPFLRTVVELQRLIEDKATQRVDLNLEGADLSQLDTLRETLLSLSDVDKGQDPIRH